MYALVNLFIDFAKIFHRDLPPIMSCRFLRLKQTERKKDESREKKKKPQINILLLMKKIHCYTIFQCTFLLNLRYSVELHFVESSHTANNWGIINYLFVNQIGWDVKLLLIRDIVGSEKSR